MIDLNGASEPAGIREGMAEIHDFEDKPSAGLKMLMGPLEKPAGVEKVVQALRADDVGRWRNRFFEIFDGVSEGAKADLISVSAFAGGRFDAEGVAAEDFMKAAQNTADTGADFERKAGQEGTLEMLTECDAVFASALEERGIIGLLD